MGGKKCHQSYGPGAADGNWVAEAKIGSLDARQCYGQWLQQRSFFESDVVRQTM